MISVPYLLIEHAVESYDSWKQAFDDHAATREDAGCLGGHLFHVAGNPDDVTILFEWDSLENARAFVDSDDLRATMEKAGVVGQPSLTFLEKLEDVAV